MALQLTQVTKSFGEPATQVLSDINLTIEDGEFIALTGRSGSGKSTLLYVMSTLDTPTSGLVKIDGAETSQWTSAEMHRFRNLNMGFVFQFHHLLPELTAIENVLMPAIKTNQEKSRRPLAVELLREFELHDKQDRLPSQLSGGEQQRVAIARALIMEPRYIFADEPTGNLDSMNGNTVMDLLARINQKHKTTIIFVTHDPGFAEVARRQVRLVDGRIS